MIAYSTLSQLGYMTVALGVSAYSAAIFHLMTHAFFKALLFLAAGSVIIGMHHEQDMRKMGGLARYMPITAVTCWIGALALVGTPLFSGFYSKDAIIEAVGESHRWGATYAYYCVLGGAFVTALYTFRMLFMTFHGAERFRHPERVHSSDSDQTVGHEEAASEADAQGDDFGHAGAAAHGVAFATAGGHGHADSTRSGEHGHADHGHEPHESPAVVTIPLIALAIPSVVVGFFTADAILFGGYFGSSIRVLAQNDVLRQLAPEFHGPLAAAVSGLAQPTFWVAAAGVLTAWVFFLWRPIWADVAARRVSLLYTILVNKYYFDWFNEHVVTALTRGIGTGLWKAGDQGLIDGALVNGSANTVGWFGGVLRRVQSGYLYAYAFWMVIGLAVLLGWFLVRT